MKSKPKNYRPVHAVKSPDNTHRMTLRIPQWLVAKVDEKRQERIGSISRNLWILEQLEKACKK